MPCARMNGPTANAGGPNGRKNWTAPMIASADPVRNSATSRPLAARSVRIVVRVKMYARIRSTHLIVSLMASG